MESSTTTIRLDLRMEGDNLTGTAVNGSGRREFTGWIGLLAAIDGLVGGGSPFTSQEAPMSIDVTPASIIRPGDERFDQARQAFNLDLTQAAELVARPRDVHEVIELVHYAREHGYRIAPQRTGHNAGPIDWERPAILLRTDAMLGWEVDAGNLTARVRGGARWEDMVDDLSDMGLSALHGSARDIGIAGYSLGGGVGWQARKRGMQTNSVTAIELVTADGELIRADHENEPELFWALRGGGGNFGVVTALEFRLYPLERVYAGAMFYPLERAGEVLHAWREWTHDLPDEITSVGRIVRIPDIPDIPEPLRGNSFSLVEAVHLGDEAEGAALTQPLRELGPAIDTFAMVPPAALSWLHMDPEDPLPYTAETMLTGDLDAAAIDDVVQASGADSGSDISSMEIRHLGGALARRAPHHGARATLDGSYLMMSIGMADGQGRLEKAREDAIRVRDALAPYASGSQYLNFVEDEYDVSKAFDEDSWRRLVRVKEEVDPDELFLANHQIRVS